MRWIPFVNLLLIALIALTALGIVFYVNKEESHFEAMPPLPEATFPKNSFQSPGLETIATGPFALNWVAPHMSLPNLQSEMIYHGTSERPDFTSTRPLFHLSVGGSDQIFAVEAGRPFYLSYQGIIHHKGEGGNYVYSPYRTALWLEMYPQMGGKKLDVTVHMLDENGMSVLEPAHFMQFTLAACPLPKEKTAGWELGEFRVDSTLLIRQKARWVGNDRFLQEHGGNEFEFSKDRERIDFSTSDLVYSCFVKGGDFLIWNDGRWKMPKPGETTLGQPLLVVKKVEEKVVVFELWDSEGRGKTALNLIRAKDLGGMPNLDQEFRFVGAKTWAQFIVESHGERFVLRPHDWIVLTTDGWVKLDSPEKIDDYVTQKIVGPLLILDKMSKQNGKQMLLGHLFNSSRTEMQPIELTAISNSSLANSVPFYFKPDSMDDN